MKYKNLILNLGSTSTKVAVYENTTEVFKKSVNHSAAELGEFNSIWQQEDFRKKKITEMVAENGSDLSEFNAISCRGGNSKPIPGGIYILNQNMIDDMRSEKYGLHPTSVGNEIAYRLGLELGIPAIIVDPPVTDELCACARYSGVKEIPRLSSFHALNHKRTARLIADKMGKMYEDVNLIVCHLGGGISVAPHEKGRVIDVNNALDGDGPFSPERAGTVPAGDLIRMCFSGKYTQEEMIRKVRGGGGLVSYLGTTDVPEIVERIEAGDEYALEVFTAMAYHIAKEIGAAAAVLTGKIDGIVFTGGLANSELLVEEIRKRVGFIAEIHSLPGENEMLSLAEGALRYLSGQEQAQVY